MKTIVDAYSFLASALMMILPFFCSSASIMSKVAIVRQCRSSSNRRDKCHGGRKTQGGGSAESIIGRSSFCNFRGPAVTNSEQNCGSQTPGFDGRFDGVQRLYA